MNNIRCDRLQRDQYIRHYDIAMIYMSQPYLLQMQRAAHKIMSEIVRFPPKVDFKWITVCVYV